MVASLASISLWAGFVGMTLGTGYFLWRGWSVEDPYRREYYVITIFVPAIAAVSYLAMAVGFGVVTVDGGPGVGETQFFWARYADWLFTTPLLLIDLCLLADADRRTILTLVTLDVFMVAAGVGGALAGQGQTVRIAWWAVSTGALLGVLFLLFDVLSDRAGELPAARAALYERLRNLTVGLWLLYPAVWVLGTQAGIEVLSLGLETAAFAVLDLTAKIVFGYLLLRDQEVLVAEHEAATSVTSGD